MASGETTRQVNEDRALRAVVEGTASETGEQFYRALVKNLALALDTHGAWVTEFHPETQTMRALAIWFGGQWLDEFEYGIAGTPCAAVIHHTELIHIPERLIELYPKAPLPGAERFPETSYLGMPLLDGERNVLGHLAVVDIRPMPAEKRLLALFEIFANRAAAEMRRLRLEAELRERQDKLERLVGSAMDAIVELDDAFRVTLLNPAARKAFGWEAGRSFDGGVEALVGGEARRRLEEVARELDRRTPEDRAIWIPGSLAVQPPDRKG